MSTEGVFAIDFGCNGIITYVAISIGIFQYYTENGARALILLFALACLITALIAFAIKVFSMIRFRFCDSCANFIFFLIHFYVSYLSCIGLMKILPGIIITSTGIFILALVYTLKSSIIYSFHTH